MDITTSGKSIRDRALAALAEPQAAETAQRKADDRRRAVDGVRRLRAAIKDKLGLDLNDLVKC